MVNTRRPMDNKLNSQGITPGNAPGSAPGYTGGQYSIVRVAIGLFLLLYLFLQLPMATTYYSNQGLLHDGKAAFILRVIPNVLSLSDQPQFIMWILLMAMGMCGLLMIGWYDRMAAGALWYLLACFHARNPLIGSMVVPLIGWVLLVHVLLPPSPYGSLSARGRIDSRGIWSMPTEIYAAMWLLLVATYFYFGIDHITNENWLSGDILYRTAAHPNVRPIWMRDIADMLSMGQWRMIARVIIVVELGFAPLALFQRSRALLWSWTLVLHQAILASVVFSRTNVGLLLLHMICFDPSWIRPRPDNQTDMIFYDGSCGLCHNTVRFILAEDMSEEAFRFAPLDGEAFISMLSKEQRAHLPDSLVVKTVDGQVLLRSAGVIYILRRLGGMWVIVADFLSVVPRPVRDMAYNQLAKVRYKLFRRQKDACPLMPPEWRSQFVL